MNMMEKLAGLNLKEQNFEYKSGKEVYKFIIREMDGCDAAEYESSLYKVVGDEVKPTTKLAKIKIVLYTLHDEEGNRVYQDKDIAAIKKLPGSFIEKVYNIASKLNKLEDAEKN